MKKLFIIILSLFILTGCKSKSEFVPTAIISNINYNSETLDIEFQLDITDKSNILENATIQLLSNEETRTISYTSNQALYTFDNISNNSNYYIKVYATYSVNETLLQDTEIYSLNISSYLSTNEIYFSSQTFSYTGDKYSIYLSNINDEYTVEYKGNNQSEVGIYEVVANVYNNKELIGTYKAYLVITESTPELIAYNQTHKYTSHPITVDYKISNNAKVEVTYNNSSEIPTQVGLYNVVIKSGSAKVEVIMLIEKANIIIESTNQTVYYTGQTQEIEVQTNIPCDYTVTYNGKTQKPTSPGEYEVIIKVESNSNINGATKYLTLTILEEENLSELIISQVIHLANDEIYIELFNPTNKRIDLTDYKILLGKESNNKYIELKGEIPSLDTYTIVSKEFPLNYTYDLESNYLLVNPTDTISLVNNQIVDKIELSNNVNYIRKHYITTPSTIYKSSEWDITSNTSSINEHTYHVNSNLNYEVFYSNEIYLNINDEVNYNDHIEVKYNNEIINITSDMILTNNLNINEFGTYTVNFIIDTYEFNVSFIVTDTLAPTITLKDTSLVFNLNEEIDYLSLIEVVDNTDNDPEVYYSTNVDITKEGAYEVTYYAKDKYDNTNIYKVYIFIKSS